METEENEIKKQWAGYLFDGSPYYVYDCEMSIPLNDQVNQWIESHNRLPLAEAELAEQRKRLNEYHAQNVRLMDCLRSLYPRLDDKSQAEMLGRVPELKRGEQ